MTAYSILAFRNNDSEQVVLQGWTSSPNQRGSFDIVWSCTSTIFVCAWVMLHLNLPAKQDSQIKEFCRKMKWFMLAILAPELVMLCAGGQWASARRSLADMKDRRVAHWTLTHAFYADSGGFVLAFEGFPSFPVTAKEMAYLLRHNYIDAPGVTRDEIRDKSKADVFAKTFAAVQSAWFIIQIVGRAASQLPVTLLELSTIAIMCCSAATLFFWWFKPLNVKVPTFIKPKTSISTILLDAGEAAKAVWTETPLDFIEPIGYMSSHLPFRRFLAETTRPLPRIPNDKDSLLHSWAMIIVITIPTAAFGALQFIAWNFAFPTRAEQLLWRYLTVAICVVLGTYCVVEALYIAWTKFTVPGMQTFSNYKDKFPWSLFLYVPGTFYFFARAIIIIEVIISLRAQDARCYTNVNWSDVIPHL